MDEQEARDAVWGAIDTRAKELDSYAWTDMRGQEEVEPIIGDALDAYRDAVLAGQPCYRIWFVADDSMPSCLDVGGDHPKCEPCQARERMKAREQVPA